MGEGVPGIGYHGLGGIKRVEEKACSRNPVKDLLDGELLLIASFASSRDAGEILPL